MLEIPSRLLPGLLLGSEGGSHPEGEWGHFAGHFLPFQSSFATWKKVFDQVPLKEQAVPFHIFTKVLNLFTI